MRTTLARISNTFAPRPLRFPPKILRATTIGRSARSARLFVPSTSGFPANSNRHVRWESTSFPNRPPRRDAADSGAGENSVTSTRRPFLKVAAEPLRLQDGFPRGVVAQPCVVSRGGRSTALRRPVGSETTVRATTRNALVLLTTAAGTIGLAIGLLAPLWAFTYWVPASPAAAQSLFFSLGSPTAYFQSHIIGSGPAPPPQATLDFDIALWADLAFGIVAGVVAIFRVVLAFRRESVPALAQAGTVTSLGLAAVATVLLFVVGPAAYAPGTWCSACTAYAGYSGSNGNDWAWNPELGTVAVVIATGAFVIALLLEARGVPNPDRWLGRLGAVGVVSGIALFSVVFGNNWQAWYPTGDPYLLLWGLIIAIPVGSAALALRAKRRALRTDPSQSP